MKAWCALCWWPKRYHLLDHEGEERPAAWQIAQGKRSWGYRWLHDPRRGEDRKVRVVALGVRHPAHTSPLWLVVARPGKGQEPWYLVTADPVPTEAAAWGVVGVYARRWQIELTWCYGKASWVWRVRV